MQRDAKHKEPQFRMDDFYEWDNGGKDLVAIQQNNEQDQFFEFEQLPDEPAPKAEFAGWVDTHRHYSPPVFHSGDAFLIALDSLGVAVAVTIKGVALFLNGFGRLVFWVGAALVWFFPVRIKWPRNEPNPPTRHYEETTFYHHKKINW